MTYRWGVKTPEELASLKLPLPSDSMSPYFTTHLKDEYYVTLIPSRCIKRLVDIWIGLEKHQDS